MITHHAWSSDFLLLNLDRSKFVININRNYDEQRPLLLNATVFNDVQTVAEFSLLCCFVCLQLITDSSLSLPLKQESWHQYNLSLDGLNKNKTTSLVILIWLPHPSPSVCLPLCFLHIYSASCYILRNHSLLLDALRGLVSCCFA